ncbi:MAG: deoxyhypusine synthase, partial [Haloarculaceae archaeon]
MTDDGSNDGPSDGTDDHEGAGDPADGDGVDDSGPPREEFRHDPIAHAEARAGMTVADLAESYGDAGIGAATLHEAVDVYAEMLGREDVTNFFGLAGAMVPAGMRRIVAELIRDGHVDALVTTGANLTHDTIEAIGGKHHHGRAGPNDARPAKTTSGPNDEDEPRASSAGESSAGESSAGESSAGESHPLREHDERLRDEGVDRIYNVYLPQEYFTTFERHLRERVFPDLAADGAVSIQRLTERLGRANAAVNDEDDVAEDPGILVAAAENDVPVYCPSVQDSVLGLQAWMYSQTSDFTLDALADMTTITDQAHDADRAGAMLVGGGVPKNYVLQTMLVSPDAYDYAVQLTMDPPQTG